MGKLGPDPKEWLPELRAIVLAMNRALRGREPSFALLSAMRQEYEHCIPGHAVSIAWFSDGDGTPRDEPHPPVYGISLIRGERFLENWLMFESDLYRVLRGEVPCEP